MEYLSAMFSASNFLVESETLKEHVTGQDFGRLLLAAAPYNGTLFPVPWRALRLCLLV
jgi:hypothetical protein